MNADTDNKITEAMAVLNLIKIRVARKHAEQLKESGSTLGLNIEAMREDTNNLVRIYCANERAAPLPTPVYLSGPPTPPGSPLPFTPFLNVSSVGAFDVPNMHSFEADRYIPEACVHCGKPKATHS